MTKLLMAAFLFLAACGETGRRDVGALEAAALLQEDKAIRVLDIRTPGEFGRGHIAGAENIDFRGVDFEQKLQGLERDKPYLLHCASGNRSGQALPVFEDLGFTRIHHLNTGFKGWVAAGLPVAK